MIALVIDHTGRDSRSRPIGQEIEGFHQTEGTG
jgi:hypothetical protein